MTATLAGRSSVPFHLGITEPIDGAAITSCPALDGAYDPGEQIWMLPDGTPLIDSKVIESSLVETHTYSVVHGIISTDDEHLDPGTG